MQILALNKTSEIRRLLSHRGIIPHKNKPFSSIPY